MNIELHRHADVGFSKALRRRERNAKQGDRYFAVLIAMDHDRLDDGVRDRSKTRMTTLFGLPIVSGAIESVVYRTD